MPNFLAGDSAKLLLPIGATLAAALIGAVITWAKDLNASARRARFLDESLKSVQFWEIWLRVLDQADEDLSAEKAAVIIELRLTGESVRTRLRDRRSVRDWTLKEFLTYQERIPNWRRVLLLYRAPSGPSRLAKYLFFFCISQPLVMFLAILYTPSTVSMYDAMGWVGRGVEALSLVIVSRALFSVFESMYIWQMQNKI